MKKLTLIILVIVAAAINIAAQQEYTDRIKAAKLKTKITAEYDKFQDRTELFSARSTIKGDLFGQRRRVEFYLHTSFNGADIVKPADLFWVHLKVTLANISFDNVSRAIFLADGERVYNQTRPVHTVNVVRAGNGILYVERVAIMLTREGVEKIAKAKKVEMQVGGYEATLAQEEIDAFADMLQITEAEPE